MGRVLLIALVTVVLGACDSPDTAGDPHADLSCAACHAGPQGERGRATVPEASCTTAGCHEAGGPAEVQVATVTFPHRDHADGHEIESTCAGCHTHPTGEAPLQASVEACALCHVADVTSAEAQECRLCHEQPDHASLTSQGVAVSHSQLPWIDIGCVRCHYDVAEAETEVPAMRCRQCHDDLAVLNEEAVGRDLHPIHEGLTCTACHAAGLHEVRAMSSAVELVCSDCHRQGHQIELATSESGAVSEVCARCHTGVHAAQQRLLLGIRPDGGTMPSEKFLAGITCRSCHVPPEAPTSQPEEPIRGQATACAGCHEQEYEEVLDWWIDGSRARLSSARTYVERAGSAVAGSDSAATLLEGARSMIALVDAAGAQHNLELSDRLLRDAVQAARNAYRAAGVQPRTPPDLGRVPHAGMCSYCHYGPDEPWDFEAMPDDFHRSVLSPDR